ncbi:hypothetical protein BD626DRAFT_632188 [Schizophyllum amplum]|uniref:Uncharacterized protein n=1 Tax=Schizophyllum amplum TaxID=97359 RepID=A0A550C7F6_9AGAR|nr:hypothetical protein BD626DRAFT_632188 [Auriculariopsis ampla]
MDDPWGNAWADNNNERPRSPIVDLKVDVKFDAPGANDGQEADIALPSWSAGPGVEWADPAAYSGADLWGKLNTTEDAHGWASESSFADIPLGKTLEPEDLDANSEDEEEEEEDETPPQDEDDVRHTYHSPIPPSPSPSPPPSPPRISASPPFISRPATPEEQGAFANEADDAWSPPVDATVAAAALDSTADAWGTEWAQDTDTQSLDEWEAAKQRKAKQDHYVPPELLASILTQLADFSRDYWPDENKDTEGKPDAENERDEDPAPRTPTHTRQTTIHELDGMDTLIERLVPHDVSISGSSAFPKSFTVKRMADAIRTTRHASLARLSPMYHLASSKSSLQWEASVKARPEYNEDAVVPMGWKILPKEERVEPLSPTERKTPSGLFSSLFGRRSATPPISAATSRPGTPRASMDPPLTPSRASPASVKSPTMPTPPPMQITQSASPAPAVPTTPAMSRAQSSGPEIFPAPAPAPSAVSRFLNRFSRKSSSSDRASLALSTDDLDFLSDVEVPSPETKPGHRATSSFNLNMAFESPASLPPRLAPPPPGPKIAPLPPPPMSARPQSMPASKSSSPSVYAPPTLLPTVTGPAAVRTVPMIPAPMQPMSPVMTGSSVASMTTSGTASTAPQNDLMDLDFGAFDMAPPVPEQKPLTIPVLAPPRTAMPQAISRPQSIASRSQSPAVGNSARRGAPTAIMSSVAAAAVTVPKLAPAFSLAPPSSSTQPTPMSSSTPMTSSRPGHRPGSSISRQPPPQPVIPPSLLGGDGDDDDFSDFSSAIPAERNAEKSFGGFSPEGTTQGLVANMSPALFGSESPGTFASPSAFGDLASGTFGSTTMPNGQSTQSLASIPSTASTNSAMLGQTSMASGFDDFDDFVSPTTQAPTSASPWGLTDRGTEQQQTTALQTPSPPKLPAKNKPPPLGLGLQNNYMSGQRPATGAYTTPEQAGARDGQMGGGQTLTLPGQSRDVFSPPPPLYSPSVMPPPKMVSGAAHMRTLSLMEAAAGRKSRWPPAPPSPLPEAIPGPPLPGALPPSPSVYDAPSGDWDFLKDEGAAGVQSTGGPLQASTSSPAALAKPGGKFVRPPPLLDVGTPLKSKAAAPPTPTIPTLAPPPVLGKVPTLAPPSGAVRAFPSGTAHAPSIPVLAPPSMGSASSQSSSGPTLMKPASQPPPAQADPFAGFFGADTPPATKSASGQSKQGGGLTAQDLSFFEGL